MTDAENNTAVSPFTARAFPTKRKVAVPPEDNVPTLLIFVGAQSATQIETVITGIRREIPDPETLLVVNVVDLRGVPKLMKGMAERVIRAAYDTAAKQIPNGYDPADQLILIPDWKGTIFKAYDVDNVNQQVHLVMVNGAGERMAAYSGDNPAAAGLEMARAALNGSG